MSFKAIAVMSSLTALMQFSPAFAQLPPDPIHEQSQALIQQEKQLQDLYARAGNLDLTPAERDQATMEADVLYREVEAEHRRITDQETRYFTEAAPQLQKANEDLAQKINAMQTRQQKIMGAARVADKIIMFIPLVGGGWLVGHFLGGPIGALKGLGVWNRI